ncbi:hypothetical protein [Tropicibacter sp. R16_0]|uniref:hypothetical protein n=1 Tax=Tropicibacter sp. R16_0 TaxID=2821102 RepID=UPI001ADAC62A|nr:hypothetical protein [Tropicibacter sp. R16_0]
MKALLTLQSHKIARPIGDIESAAAGGDSRSFGRSLPTRRGYSEIFIVIID